MIKNEKLNKFYFSKRKKNGDFTKPRSITATTKKMALDYLTSQVESIDVEFIIYTEDELAVLEAARIAEKKAKRLNKFKKITQILDKAAPIVSILEEQGYDFQDSLDDEDEERLEELIENFCLTSYKGTEKYYYLWYGNSDCGGYFLSDEAAVINELNNMISNGDDTDSCYFFDIAKGKPIWPTITQIVMKDER